MEVTRIENGREEATLSFSSCSCFLFSVCSLVNRLHTVMKKYVLALLRSPTKNKRQHHSIMVANVTYLARGDSAIEQVAPEAIRGKAVHGEGLALGRVAQDHHAFPFGAKLL